MEIEHDGTRYCIYCQALKPQGEFTLEHTIPQFLGGAYGPDQFKTREVCKKCNSDLGLFVDAGFEKDWLVSNKLRDLAFSSFDPALDKGLPLICMGQSDLVPPRMQDGEICESWLGPLGEQIYWVRPHDERLYWYAGGNPRTTKTSSSRAYFMFSERSHKDALLPWRAFRDSFEGRRVKKLMCTEVIGSDPKVIGFEDADDLDKERINFFLESCARGGMRNNKFSMYTQYDVRFMAKLAIGISYSLFGEKSLQTAYAEELYRALRHRAGDEPGEMRGSGPLTREPDGKALSLFGNPSAVTLAIVPASGGVAINLNIGGTMNWVVLCATSDNLRPAEIDSLGMGRVIILYRQLQRGVELALPEYIAHKTGTRPNEELEAIGKRLNLFSTHLKSLSDIESIQAS